MKESPEQLQEGPELIKTPEDSYFIHGVEPWDRNKRIGIFNTEISVSLQKDGFTNPLRPYGFVLSIEKGGIRKAFPRDVASRRGDWAEKELKETSPQVGEFSEDDLEKLLSETPIGKHNELWVNGEKINIVGSYIDKSRMTDPGAKQFLKAVKEVGLEIRIIE